MAFLWNPWKVLINEDTWKKEENEYDTFCIRDENNQIATHTKLLNIMYKFYGFSGIL